MTIRLDVSVRRARWLASAVFLTNLAACDLPMKDLGDETAGGSDTGGDTDGATGMVTGGVEPGAPCTPGDQAPADDGCNTCECTPDGTWACTLIGCPDSSGDSGGGECTPGDTMPAPDGCNTCACGDDGLWACTQLGCGGECMPGEEMLAPDGCNECFCDDSGAWACTDAACAPSVQVCDGTEPADPITIVDAAVVGDDLVTTVQHGGGCETHVYRYCWDGAFLESFPVQAATAISHDANGDFCEALLTEELSYSLLPMRTAYEAGYGPGPATIEINLDGWVGSLPYSW
jgi:hypothetical protein